MSNPEKAGGPESLLGGCGITLLGEVDGGAIGSGLGLLEVVDVWRGLRGEEGTELRSGAMLAGALEHVGFSYQMN